MIPRGNPVHELIHLPYFWFKMKRATPSRGRSERHAYGDHARQYYLLFEPPAGRPRRNTTVVYLHGGGWQFGSPERFTANAAVFLERGYPVVLPSVRRLPRYNFRHFEADLHAFASHLLPVQAARGRAGHSLLIAGMSSGAHLAAHLVYNRGLLRALPGAPPVRGLILCGAPLDLSRMPNTPVIRWLTGGRANPLFRQADPRTHLNGEEHTPVLFVHGTHDGLTPLASARSFYETLPTPRNRLHFHLLEGGTHLDAASWSHSDNEVRRLLLEWVEEKGNEP